MSKKHLARPSWRLLKRCLGPLLALLLAPLAAQGAPPGTTTVSAGLKLDFGSFAVLPSCANCTVTMRADGSRIGSAGIYLLPSKPGQLGTFSVTCNGNGICAYTPSIAGTTTISAGSVTMTVGTFNITKGSPNTPSTVSVGGVLTIRRSGSPASTYTSAPYTVTTTSP